jgi:hypothetical protein
VLKRFILVGRTLSSQYEKKNNQNETIKAEEPELGHYMKINV